MGTFTPDLLTGSQHSCQHKSAQFLNEICNMKDETTSLLKKKLKAFYLRHTRTRSDTGSEPGETLVTLGTMCVTQCPERSFLSVSNACCSKSVNTCAINSSTDHLQPFGKTCRPASQKIQYCAHKDEVSHLSRA